MKYVRWSCTLGSYSPWPSYNENIGSKTPISSDTYRMKWGVFRMEFDLVFWFTRTATKCNTCKHIKYEKSKVKIKYPAHQDLNLRKWDYNYSK